MDNQPSFLPPGDDEEGNPINAEASAFYYAAASEYFAFNGGVQHVSSGIWSTVSTAAAHSGIAPPLPLREGEEEEEKPPNSSECEEFDSDFNDSEFAEDVSEDLEEDEEDLEEKADLLYKRFESILATTISEAERFLDDPEILQGIWHNARLERGCSCPPKAPSPPAPEKVRSIETQTDLEEDCVTRSSGTLVPSEGLGVGNSEDLGKLENIRQSLLQELRLGDLRHFCRVAEAVDVVERCLQLKGGVCPPEEVEESVKHLNPQDLRKLVGHFVEKAVEIRYCSEMMERRREIVGEKQGEVQRRLQRKKEEGRELERQHQARVKEFLSRHGNPEWYSRYKRKEEQLQGARKRQQDLEKSLTALLVRHGYLVDGVDWEVQQVVDTLGIDEEQLKGGNGGGEMGRVTRRGGISEAPVEQVAKPEVSPVKQRASRREEAAGAVGGVELGGTSKKGEGSSRGQKSRQSAGGGTSKRHNRQSQGKGKEDK